MDIVRTMLQVVEKATVCVSGGGVLVSSDSIWTTANEDDLLIRLSLSD